MWKAEKQTKIPSWSIVWDQIKQNLNGRKEEEKTRTNRKKTHRQKKFNEWNKLCLIWNNYSFHNEFQLMFVLEKKENLLVAYIQCVYNHKYLNMCSDKSMNKSHENGYKHWT